MISVHEQRGIEIGIQQGIEQGIEQGVLRGQRELLLTLLRAKFGDLPAETVAAVEAVADTDELRRLSERVLTALTFDDMGLTAR